MNEDLVRGLLRDMVRQSGNIGHDAECLALGKATKQDARGRGEWIRDTNAELRHTIRELAQAVGVEY